MTTDNHSILDLAVRGRWSSVLARAWADPDELGAADDDGMTVFHWACANDTSPRTLQALLHVDELRSSNGHSSVVLRPDSQGLTPLMAACASASNAELVAQLVNKAPSGIDIADAHGWTALHYSCATAKEHTTFLVSVLPLLLNRSVVENRAIAFRKDVMGHGPFDLLCHSYGISEESLSGSASMSSMDDVACCWPFVTFFLGLLDPPGSDSWPALCRFLAFPDLPLVAAAMALRFNKDDLLRVNEDGNTPLHIAVSKRWERGLVKLVAEACPRAASLRNDRGLLPLQMALKTPAHAWNDDICALIHANPSCLESLELHDSTYPNLLERIKIPSTVFLILRSKPTLVRRRTEGDR